MAKFRKAIGALLGGVTGAVVVGVCGMFDIDVDPGLALAIATVLAAAGTWLAPPNKPPS